MGLYEQLSLFVYIRRCPQAGEVQMNDSTSISNLITSLKTVSGHEFVRLFREAKVTSADINTYTCWSSAEYTRNCIARSDRYELLLLCWAPGQVTPVHCHGGEECWVMMIEGALREDRYEQDAQGKLILKRSATIQDHYISYMNDDLGLHRLANTSDQRAISLHLYMNPIPMCKVYDEALATHHVKQLQYHTDRSADF